MAEKFANAMLDQIEHRYRADHNDGGRGDHPNNFELSEQPARPLESLASQSQPILGSTGSPAEGHPILGDETLGLKHQRKNKDKKKEEEVDDDNFD